MSINTSADEQSVVSAHTTKVQSDTLQHMCFE